MTDLHKLAAEKFTSGNEIEIERITITRAEYEAALAQPKQDISYTDIQMAELIMSDCGHSSDYTPLLNRIAGRLATYRQALAQPEQEPPKREWLSLTHEEAREIAYETLDLARIAVVLVTDKKLKEKNT